MDAQNITTIKGNVVNDKGESTIGNIIIMSIVDSSFITGSSFFETAFEIDNINKTEVLVKITSLQFEDKIIAVTYDGQSRVDLGNIKVANSALALDEITVSSKRPVYLQQADGTIDVLIQNTTLAASNSVSEILSKSPDIVIDETGSIAVFGKGNAILYLNGKRITDSQLTLISPSNIKKISIIRNPSSKYDAEGAAVINISTITQTDDGYQVNVKQNLSNSKFGGTISNSSLNLNYKKGDFSTNTYYSLQVGKERERLHTTRDREIENTFLKTDLTTDWNREFKNFSAYGIGFQYNTNNKSYISLEYSGFYELLGGVQLSNNKITDSNGLSFYDSNIKRDELEMNNSLSLNYNHVIDTLSSALFIGGQYTHFDSKMDNDITEKNEEINGMTSRLLKNLFDLNLNLLSGQVDYTKHYANKSSLELGTKVSHIENESAVDFLVSNNTNDYTLDEELSNNFNYKESIAAAYLSFKGRFKNDINYSIGLRSEFTKYNLNLSQVVDQKIKDQYLNLFPNLSLNKIYSDDFLLNFSYSSRINRPAYQRLNPVLVYQDPYTSIQGNPELKPEKVQAFELVAKLKKNNVKVGYNCTIDPLGATALRGKDDKSYVLIGINYDESHQFFTSVSRVFNYKFWTSTNTVSLKYTTIKESTFDFETVKPRPQLYLFTNNQFNLSNNYKAEIYFWYRGDNYEGLHLRKNIYGLNITLEKSFFEKSLKCRLMANDIFHTVIASGYYNVGQTDVYYNRRWSTDYFRVSLIYDFGKLKKVSYKNKAIGESESNRAF